jgi:hypothetical protein
MVVKSDKSWPWFGHIDWLVRREAHTALCQQNFWGNSVRNMDDKGG